ncbi:MAG: hypothetical protein ACREUW_14990 [Burkholderiales bacterium]
MTQWQAAWRVVCEPQHLRATGLIALVVGSWLTLVNQADVILAQGLGGLVALKIALNYLTPFVVSNLGLLSRKPEP